MAVDPAVWLSHALQLGLSCCPSWWIRYVQFWSQADSQPDRGSSCVVLDLVLTPPIMLGNALIQASCGLITCCSITIAHMLFTALRCLPCTDSWQNKSDPLLATWLPPMCEDAFGVQHCERPQRQVRRGTPSAIATVPHHRKKKTLVQQQLPTGHNLEPFVPFRPCTARGAAMTLYTTKLQCAWRLQPW